MPRFYFDVILNGHRTRDWQGMELPDKHAARDAAITAAKEVIEERGYESAPNGAFLIADASGETILTIRFDQVLGPSSKVTRWEPP